MKVRHKTTGIKGTVIRQHGDIATVQYSNEKDMPTVRFYGGVHKVDVFITHRRNLVEILD
jgi:hypothetical protein